MNLVDFVHSSNRAENSEELIQYFLKFLTEFGYDKFMMAELSHETTSDKEKNLGTLVNYPAEWLEHYLANHYVNYDPVYQKGITATRPYTWEEIINENISKRALNVMNEAKEFDLHSGIGVSIHQPSGKIIGIGFAGSETDARHDNYALNLIHAASHHLVTAYSDMLKIDSLDNYDCNFSFREREVLHWIACGKTKSEVAEILSVSKSCIKRHCENVFYKLNVNNLSSAVAKAFRMGIINF